MSIKELKKELYESNFTKWGLDIRLSVALISTIVIFLYLLYASFNSDTIYGLVIDVKSFILSNFGFIFVTLIVIAIVVVLFLGIYKPTARIKLGKADDKPDFSTFSWYTMLFSAGVGIGLLFYATYEPLDGVLNSPLFENSNAVVTGISTAVFHWGLTGWAVYAIVAIALGYYTFNMNLPLSPRSLFYPLFKEKIFGIIGDIIDAIAIVATLFGLSSSLGLGALQLNAGFDYLFGIEMNIGFQIFLIVLITFIATLSILTGLKKGVRILSELNIYFVIALVSIIFIVGPTLLIILNFGEVISEYFNGFLDATFNIFSYDIRWTGQWTIFYWAWWAAWSLFVGLFIAKISKGRTIRECVVAFTVIPSIISLVWFCVFGTTAGSFMDSAHDLLVAPELSLYALTASIFNNPVALFLVNLLVIILIFSFFITSSDSGSLVVDSLASAGRLKSPRGQKVFWASLEGILAIVILVAGGSDALYFLQNTLIIIGLPLAIILISSTVIFVIKIVKDSATIHRKEQKEVGELNK